MPLQTNKNDMVASVSGDKGKKGEKCHPDYIFLQETDGINYMVTKESTNNNPHNVINGHEGIKVGYSKEGSTTKTELTNGASSHLEGVFIGGKLVLGDKEHTEIETPTEDGTPFDYDEYAVTVTAHVTDLDGSEHMKQGIVLTGLPAGAEVTLADGQVVIVGTDGKLTIDGSPSEYSGVVGGTDANTQLSANITVRVPKDSELTLKATAKTYEGALGDTITKEGSSEPFSLLSENWEDTGSAFGVSANVFGRTSFKGAFTQEDSSNSNLSLADLLSNEESGDLGSYFSFEQSGADTVLRVNTKGLLATQGHDQEIILTDMNAADITDSYSNQLDTILTLIDQGRLQIDM